MGGRVREGEAFARLRMDRDLGSRLGMPEKTRLKKKIADIAAGVADRSKVDTNRKLASLRIEWSLALLSKRKRSASQMLLYGGGWTWEWDLCTGNT